MLLEHTEQCQELDQVHAVIIYELKGSVKSRSRVGTQELVCLLVVMSEVLVVFTWNLLLWFLNLILLALQIWWCIYIYRWPGLEPVREDF